MTAPLVPLVAGAALGAVATLLFRDSKISTTLRSGAAKAAGSVSEAALKVKEAIEPEENPAEETDASAEDAADAAERPAEA